MYATGVPEALPVQTLMMPPLCAEALTVIADASLQATPETRNQSPLFAETVELPLPAISMPP